MKSHDRSLLDPTVCSPRGRYSALLLSVFFVCGSFTVALAQPVAVAPLAGHTTPAPVFNGSAKLVGHADPNQMLRIVFGLQVPNKAAEEQFLRDLQDRSSQQFHKFLSRAEWIARFSPSPQQEQAVVDWAQAQGLGVTSRYPNRLTVNVAASGSTIEKAFGIRLNNYQFGNTAFFSNDRDITLPSNLIAVVLSVEGLNNIQVLQPANKSIKQRSFPIYAPGPVVGTPVSGQSAGDPTKRPGVNGKVAPPITSGAYDPTDIFSSQAYDYNALYNQGHCCNPKSNSGSTPPQTTIAIATAGAQDPNDFVGFQAQYPYLAYHWEMIPVNGTAVPCNPLVSSCDGEGTMDFEWSTATSNSFGSYVDTSLVILYDAADAGVGTFTTMFQQILNDGYARVMSTSWGCAESYCYDTGTMSTDDNIFSEMAGEGWTLVAASGDQGATASCVAADAVQFPSSDPNIVAAGGTTMYLNSDSTFNSHTGWTGGPGGCFSNDGGSTGGNSSYFGVPGFQAALGFSVRTVPDLALNADWYNTPQNFYFAGSLSGNGGTSIVAPELAGFFAQENAYLLALGAGPIGNANYPIYYLGLNPTYAAHNPYYDITSGCNNNDVTAANGLGFFCAVGGYDAVTGWGSPNMLQLAWGITAYYLGDFAGPSVTYSGPTTGKWFNTDQTVSWSVTDSGLDGLTPTGVAGFTQAWDSNPGDPFSANTPGGGTSYYTGPQFPNATSGFLAVSSAGQGCHTANVIAWDNSGYSSGTKSYGSICYDTVAPLTTVSLSGTKSGANFTGPVTVTFGATDASSGVAGTVYQVDGASLLTYGGPFVVSSIATHKVTFHSTDKAGNTESTESATFTIQSPPPVFKATPTNLAYPNQPVGTHSPSSPITVSNAGAGTFNVSSIDLSGTNPGDYTETDNCVGKYISAATPCTINVVFTPSATGSRSAQVNIHGSAPGAPYHVTASGTGVSSNPAIGFSPSSYTFGSYKFGSSASTTITVTNIGGGYLNLNSLDFSGTNPGDFAQTNTCLGHGIAAGANCSITVAFSPLGGGTRSAVMNVHDNANGPQHLNLSGTGLLAPTITFSPSSVTWGSVKVGSSATTVITVKNSGDGVLHVTSLDFSGTNPGDFTQTDTCVGVSIGVNATCSVSLTFKPAAKGSRSGVMNVHDDVVNAPQHVNLAGTGS